MRRLSASIVGGAAVGAAAAAVYKLANVPLLPQFMSDPDTAALASTREAKARQRAALADVRGAMAGRPAADDGGSGGAGGGERRSILRHASGAAHGGTRGGAQPASAMSDAAWERFYRFGSDVFLHDALLSHPKLSSPGGGGSGGREGTA